MKFLVVTLSLILTLLTGCKTTSYQTFEGGTSTQGQGGTKDVIDGIDIWTYGTPPYEYKIIGVINDERPGGRLHVKSLHADAAAKAKEVGGDAIIIESNDSKVTGSFNTGGSSYIVGNNVYTGASQSHAVKRNYARFLVVQYIR